MLKTLAIVTVALLGGAQAAAANCVYIQGSFVFNGCPYTVMGNYAGTDGSWGGFGPIRPDRREAISKRRDAGWSLSACEYEKWKAGTCRPTPSNQL